MESTVIDVGSDELRDKLLTFLKSLRFTPAIRNGTPASSRLFILFLGEDLKTFSEDSSWPWDLAWVAEAVKRNSSNETVPVVAELEFEPRIDDSGKNSGLEYLPLGSDWCGNLI